MEIDPRLRPANDTTQNNTDLSRDSNQHHQPRPYHQFAASSGVAVSAATGSGASNVTGAYPDLSPQSSTDHLPDSTPSSSGNHPPNFGSYAYYLNEPSILPAGTGADDHDPNDPLADLKRPRACEACRQLKVRCEPDSDHPTGSCKRCAKAGRPCVVTAPTRKRQKKTDSRVAELEKKIDALTASLHASRGNEDGATPDMTSHREQDHVAPRRWLGGGPPPSRVSPALGNKRHHTGEAKVGSRDGNGLSTPFVTQPDSSSGSGSRTITHLDSASASTPSGPWPNYSQHAVDPILRSDYSNEFADVIDRGIVDVENATKAFDRYVTQLAPILPIVVFPAGTTMASIRRTKPVLFLVIMSITIGAFQPNIQMPLTNEAHRVFADKVVIKGEKSLELVQAIILSCTWYAPPDHFEELKFFQFIHMAVVIALDLGMGRRTRKKGGKQLGLLREILGKKGSLLDPDALETRRAWMGCYFLAVNASMALRRSLLVRWHPYMEESIDILQNSPDALPSDKLLVYWAKLSHIAEEIGFQFSMDDPVSNLSLSDAKVQYALKGFEKQLDQWRQEVTPEYYTPLLRHAEHVVNIYMHEISMHTDHNIDDFRPPFWGGLRDEAKVDHTTAAHVDALTACLTSIQRSLEIMASLDHEIVMSLPTIYFARTSYAFVALLKLFSAVSQSPGSLGQVFAPADLQVEAYLDQMIEHLKISGSRPGGRTPGKFCMILTLLKNWFTNRKDNDDPSQLARMPAEKADHQLGGKQGDLKSDSTRLHLLSEVATGHPDKATRSEQSSHSPGQVYPQPPANVESSMGPGSTSAQSTAGQVSSAEAESWSQYPPPVISKFTDSKQPFYPQQMAFQQQPGYNTSNAMMPGMMPPSQPPFAGFVPELGVQMPFDAEGLFSLGNILDEGFFNLAMDENQNLYMQ